MNIRYHINSHLIEFDKFKSKQAYKSFIVTLIISFLFIRSMNSNKRLLTCLGIIS